MMLVVLGGCALRQPGDAGETDGEGSSGDDGEATVVSTGVVTAAEPTTSSGDVPGTSTTAGSAHGEETGVVFISEPDAGPGECDPWVQDCPEGQKCNAYSSDGDGAWDSLKCVDVVPEPDGMYESCTVFGSAVSGEDSCDAGLMCWGVVDGVGECVGFCTGSPDAPSCADPHASCVAGGDGVITLCQPSCNPLLQDCDGGELCIPNPASSNGFICTPEAREEGQVFDPCQYANDCAAGLYCLDPELANECDPQVTGCCAPFCDISLANTCPGQGQECIQWWSEPGMVPPGLENVGVCGLP